MAEDVDVIITGAVRGPAGPPSTVPGPQGAQGPAGPQGSPGAPGTNGVNGAVGANAGFATLFGAANGMVVPAGITEIRTAGHTVAGIGGARYVEKASVNAAYVALWPAFAFLAADGRGFRLAGDQNITPQMAGALPSTDMPDGFTVNAVDNWAACQNLENWAMTINPSKERLTIDYSTATYGLSATLTITGSYYRSHHYIAGRFQYTGNTPLDNLIMVEGHQLFECVGNWYLFGLQQTGAAGIAGRKVNNGLVFRNIAQGKLGDRIYGSNFRRFLVDQNDDGATATNNCIGLVIGHVYATTCGVYGRAGDNLSSTFTATHSLGGTNLEQRSTLVLANAALYADLELYDTLSFMGEPYVVRAKTGANTIEVFPIITNPTAPTVGANSGTIWGGYGGAIRVRHQDQAGVTIDSVTTVQCGVAVKHTGQYGIRIGTLIAEGSNAAFECGNIPDGICRGLVINNYHSEGTSSQSELIGGVIYPAGFEGIILSQLRTEIIINQISAMGSDNDSSVLQGFRQIAYETLDTNVGRSTESPWGLQINFAGATYASTGYAPRPGTRLNGNTRQISNAPEQRQQFIAANSFDFTTFYDAEADRALGDCHWFDALVYGTGIAGAPSHVGIILGASDLARGYTINGGTATVNFENTARRARRIVGYFNWATKNWTVSDVAANDIPAATPQPVSIPFTVGANAKLQLLSDGSYNVTKTSADNWDAAVRTAVDLPADYMAVVRTFASDKNFIFGASLTPAGTNDNTGFSRAMNGNGAGSMFGLVDGTLQLNSPYLANQFWFQRRLAGVHTNAVGLTDDFAAATPINLGLTNESSAVGMKASLYWNASKINVRAYPL